VIQLKENLPIILSTETNSRQRHCRREVSSAVSSLEIRAFAVELWHG